MNEEKVVTEETKITIRFWVIVGVIFSILVFLGGTAFTHRERIVALEIAAPFQLKVMEIMQKDITEIKCDLKEHIKESRNGRK